MPGRLVSASKNSNCAAPVAAIMCALSRFWMASRMEAAACSAALAPSVRLSLNVLITMDNQLFVLCIFCHHQAKRNRRKDFLNRWMRRSFLLEGPYKFGGFGITAVQHFFRHVSSGYFFQ